MEVIEKNVAVGDDFNAETAHKSDFNKNAENPIIPKHVGIIMDGNGRWAKQKNKPRSYGHKRGADVVSDIIDEAFGRGVYALSLYALSHENLARPQDEVKNLIELLDYGIKKEGKRAVKNGVRFVVSGDISVLNEKSQKSVLNLQKQSEKCTAHVLNLCFNYGARQELCLAAERMIKAGETAVTPEIFNKYLYTADLPDVDLIVRTGGEKRISNFLLWQSSYAELYFTDVLWPDFNAAELDKALAWYSTRSRRFGKV